MNRIVLIGNGFDLAHGLPTRYEDFINWYWDKCLYNLKTCHYSTFSDSLIAFSLKSGQGSWQSLFWQLGYTFNAPKGIDFVNALIAEKDNFEVVLSPLLYRICKSLSEHNWVDIENEYYTLLKESVYNSDGSKPNTQEINNQLNGLLELLAQYLTTLSCDKVYPHSPINSLIYEPIRIDDISVKGLEYFYDHCNFWASQDRFSWYDQLNRYGFKDGLASILRVEVDEFLEKFVDRTYEKPMITDYSKFPQQLLRPNNTLLLSFNYTRLSDIYSGIGHIIHIHGDLDSTQSMIFGYGDELDDVYQDLLKLSDNECLKNIKSIRYLESGNYRKMLQFIESAPYQVYIMGHSCGNSDRTLLNTLFEHKNCVSIKPFYYKKEHGSDNYMEIVQNICRNFTDMKLMRDRVVNKTLCEPLPQTNYNGTPDKLSKTAEVKKYLRKNYE